LKASEHTNNIDSVIDQLLLLDARNFKEAYEKSTESKITCTITSPPYFDMYDYGGVKNQIGYGQEYHNEYLEELSKIFQDIYSITSDKGSLWIIVNTFSKNKEIVPLPFDIVRELKKRRDENDGNGWIFKNVFIWKKDKTRPWVRKGHFRQIFEYILYFVKTEDFNFYRDRIRIKDTSVFKHWWVKYPERYNPLGILPTDLWEYPIPVQGSWGNTSLNHFCPLPMDLIKRIILLTTNENDIVCDPFAGTGTVLIAASMEDRKYIGCEINQEYIKNFEKLKEELKNSQKKIDEQRAEKTKLEEELFNKIVELRMLKYSKSVFQAAYDFEVNKEAFDNINSIFIIKEPMELDLSSDPYGAKYYGKSKTYFVFKKKYDIDIDTIHSLMKRRSLRKYQIDTEIINIDREDMCINKKMFDLLYLYRSPSFYSYDKEISFSDWIKESSEPEWRNYFYNEYPPLISNIMQKINLDEIYTSKEEKLQKQIDEYNDLI